jgi:hypothetical protein
MRSAFLLPLLLAVAIGPATGQHMPHGDDQRRAWEGRRDGALMPLREIERRTIAHMPGWQYLGVDFDPESAVYTLKFLRNGMVAWVEVDGRTGAVIGRAGR